MKPLEILNQVMKTLTELNLWSVAFRVLFATVVGGCIGSERGRHGRAAGLRTHILVCLGSCMTTMIGLYVNTSLGFSGDPMRMGAQVISGIGFLGVGTILIRNHSQVTGLTTAAGLWATACIGLAVGAGFYWGSLVAFLAVMLTVSLLARFEKLSRSKDHGAYYAEFPDLQQAKDFYGEMRDLISDVDILPAKSGIPGNVGLEFVVDPAHRKTFYGIVNERKDVIISLPIHQ